MTTILLDFQFKDILNWVGGLIVFLLFLGICYLIGQLGVQIRSGINISKFINNAERDAKAQGSKLNEKGLTLKKRGRLKIILPFIGIFTFYGCVFFFVPTLRFKEASLLLSIPVVLGFFGIFLIPEQLESD
jgi:hypothetical protein